MASTPMAMLAVMLSREPGTVATIQSVLSLETITDLGLAEPILKALAAENYDKPTPIQARPANPATATIIGTGRRGVGGGDSSVNTPRIREV